MDVDRKDAMFYTQVKNREITVNNVPVESEKLHHPLPADRLPDDPNHRRCLQVASSIKSFGIGRGHVVSVVAPNVPAMYELHFAVPMSGAVLNTINTRLDARTVSVLLRHSESKLVFVDCLSRALILEALSLFPPNTQWPLLVLIADEEVAPSSTVDFISTYEDLVERGDPEFKWVRPESEWDPIILNYTSGTTSSPKAAGVPLDPTHVPRNGWTFTWGMAAVGGTNVCLRKFDARIIYDAIPKYGITHMCAAPVVLNMLSNYPNHQPLGYPVKILTAGAPPPYSVLLRTESLGFVVSHGYGMTETAGVVVSCAWKPQWDRFPASERARVKARQGVRTVVMTEVDVVDPKSGVSVKRDGSSLGEIVLRGACIMLGYLKDPEGTSKCMSKEGWLYTGDVAVMHPDGYIEIKDRSKDVIISGGENLSSVEVESVLYTHPAVNEAAVVARPDDFWGETPCAFVSLKPGSPDKPTAKEMMEYCRARMPHYMVPKTVVFKEELPKTSTGKIQKFKLRDIAKAMGCSPASRM
ncbi:putative acyl-activating enzyme 6 [Vitis vinifera]|uniref:Putative acyl-activating enzyme 6 n=1 Tax=Vitis vinifera TaxID=29760 RepID=A0A438DL57_VITVI|nr:putative acyl-activating enzyme 6 [Vitis vinifera]